MLALAVLRLPAHETPTLPATQRELVGEVGWLLKAQHPSRNPTVLRDGGGEGVKPTANPSGTLTPPETCRGLRLRRSALAAHARISVPPRPRHRYLAVWTFENAKLKNCPVFIQRAILLGKTYSLRRSSAL